jgi:tetratricopeptide (TPR) repeat protein
MNACSLLVAAALVLAGPAADDAGVQQAIALLQKGEAAQAAAILRRIVPRQDTAEIRNLLGDALEASGDLLGAAEEFQKAAHRDPTEEHLFDWGNNLLRLRAFIPATQVFEEAVKRFPRSARVHVGLGIARYSRGAFEDAVRALGTATDLDPEDARPYLFLGEMYGVSAELAGEVSRRLARFVEKQPAHALGRFYYAMSLWKAQPGAAPLADVERHLKEAATLDPQLARAHFELGVLYSDQRRYPEAIAALEQAARVEPAMAQAHYRLAQAYRRTGREDLAARALEAFERLQPR